MATSSKAQSSYVTGPRPSTKDMNEIITALWREFSKIQTAFEKGTAREVIWYSGAPSKPYDGLLVGADGTTWNPGSGMGVYCYYNSAWHFLG